MSQLTTVLSTTLTVGDERIMVEISVDPDVTTLPVMLTWSADGINTHEEFYAGVYTAIMRVAALTACAVANWDAVLVDNPTEFTARALHFIADSIQ